MRLVLAAVLAAVCGIACDEPAVPSSATQESTTIDCVPAQSSGGIPNEGGAPVWRIEGAIRRLNLLHRTFEINGVTLSVDVNTVILIDCTRAPLRNLREGAKADAVYEERDGRNTVIVVEAEGEEH